MPFPNPAGNFLSDAKVALAANGLKQVPAGHVERRKEYFSRSAALKKMINNHSDWLKRRGVQDLDWLKINKTHM
jgi:hypothetical protein